MASDQARMSATERAAVEAQAEPAAALRAPLRSHARRIALPRLVLALGGGTLLLVLLAMGGLRLAASVRAWLHAQPAFQVEFRAIELEPPPPPWIKSGRLGLLEQVRTHAGQPETFSLLDLDLETLRRSFALHSPWVRRVVRIERRPVSGSRPALRVSLAYREPVAVAQDVDKNGRRIVIDEDAVVLPAADLDLAAAGPLIVIVGLGPERYWGSPDAPDELAEPDPKVLAAARLAGFLKRHQKAGQPATSADHAIVVIDRTDRGSLVAQTAGMTQILWGEPPGSEAPGTLTAEQKWNLLGAWLENAASPQVKYPDYLEFTRQRVQVHHASAAPSANGQAPSPRQAQPGGAPGPG